MNNSLWKDAFDRLISNKLSLFGSIYILFIIILALITPLIAPYDYAYQDLDLGPSGPSPAAPRRSAPPQRPESTA